MATPVEVARLAAGAQGGTSGVKAFDDAQAQVGASRDQAIQAMKGDTVGFAGGVPAALTAQLGGNIRDSAQTALGNLSTLGAAAANQNTVDQSGTNTYLGEARAAGSAIDAQARLEESQRERLLAATRSRTSSGGALSDAELRTRLMGAATNARDTKLAALQAVYEKQLAGETAAATSAHTAGMRTVSLLPQGPAGPVGPDTVMPGGTGSGPKLTYEPDPQAAQAMNATRAALDKIRAERATLQQQTATEVNALHGPGITDEARALGQKAGLDPNRLAGLLGPAEEQRYLAEQTKLGNYTDPNVHHVSNQLLDIGTAARAMGLPPAIAQFAATAKHYLWSDPTSAANAGLKKFVAATDPAGKLYGGLATDADIAKARAAFELTPTGKGYATGVLSDVTGNAKDAIRIGWDYDTWRRNLMETPEYKQYPRAFMVGFAQAAPLFAFAAANQRTVPAGG